MISFTVITCTYQAAALVGRTLESVRNQSWPQVEHVLMDGASTDGTVDLIRSYQQEVAAAADCRHEVVFAPAATIWCS